MKHLLLTIIATLSFASILPSEIEKCIQIPLTKEDKRFYIEILENKKYSCNLKHNKIVIVRVTKELPPLLKIRTKKNTKTELIRYLWLKRHLIAIHIRKDIKKGEILIKLDNSHALIANFPSIYYKEILRVIRKVDFNQIKENIYKFEIKNFL